MHWPPWELTCTHVQGAGMKLPGAYSGVGCSKLIIMHKLTGAIIKGICVLRAADPQQSCERAALASHST